MRSAGLTCGTSRACAFACVILALSGCRAETRPNETPVTRSTEVRDVPSPREEAPRAESKTGAVFAVERSTDSTAILTPLLRIEHGVILPAFDSSEHGRAAFAANAYPAGRRYDLVSEGVRVGRAEPRGSFSPECGDDTVAWLGKVRIAPANLLKDTTLRLIAVDAVAALTPRYYSRVPVQNQDKERLRRAASSVLADSGITLAIRSHLWNVESWSLANSTGQRGLLVGTFKVDSTELGVYLFLLMTVGDKLEKADPIPATVLSLGRGNDVSAKQERLYQVLDLDGDGLPELISEADYYEGGSYKIYGYRGGRWRFILESKYVGC